MNAQDLDFVKLDVDDVGDILEIERRCFSYPWDEQQYAAGLSHGAFHVFGLRGEAGLAAYISFTVAADEMEVLNIAVRPECRREGLASRLLSCVPSSGVIPSWLPGLLPSSRPPTRPLPAPAPP